MRILIIGFLAFLAWSAFSTYIYVCKIKGLCYEPTPVQVGVVDQKDAAARDTLRKPLVEYPKDQTVYFAFDKSDFDASTALDSYVKESNAYLEQNPDAKLSLTGHTDAIGTNEYNQALGLRRAQSVQSYLEGKGTVTGKIVIDSKGESEPADDNTTKAGRANNRRTVITIKK